MRDLGLYLHIPFCKSKCLYCDFCSVPRPTEERLETYVAALIRDLERRAGMCSCHEVTTVYFGGGTPTLLPIRAWERIMETLFRRYRISGAAEITAECNPATVGRSELSELRALGVNRLSMGLQSIHENERKALGRLHTFADFRRTWEQARAAGFENLSVDVMFGIPHQTIESFHATLEAVVALEPKHLSAYALAVEEGTPFGKMGEERLMLPGEDDVREMYLEMNRFLESCGLLRYEISNFAAPGFESRHNLKYWRQEEYLGFGPAAHSDFGGERFGNSRNIEAYLLDQDITEERSRPDAGERLEEFVMLRLRLREGIDRSELERLHGKAAAERLLERIRPFAEAGFAQMTKQGFRLSEEGLLVSNVILSELIEAVAT